MDIRIQLFGELALHKGGRQTLTIENGANLRTLSRMLSDKVGGQRYIGSCRIDGGELTILVNGRNIATLDGFETKLSDGDEVMLLPPQRGCCF